MSAPRGIGESLLRAKYRAAALSVALALGACLPTSGPLKQEVINSQANDSIIRSQVDYVVVDLSVPVAEILKNLQPPSLAGKFNAQTGVPLITLGAGDTVEITIFESSAGGLFSPPGTAISGGNFVKLPAQVIDRSGNVSVPYAGLVPAIGRTTTQVQQTIEERLRDRAIEPQVVVALTDRKSNLVTVAGEVSQAGRVVIPPAGLRILDAIASAGGPKYPAYESYVTLQRGKQKATVSLAKLLTSPAENVYLFTNDTIFLSRLQQTFLVFGASGKNGQVAFEVDVLSLAEAVAKGGGLLDERADPAGVFVYRVEDRKTLEAMNFDVSRWQSEKIPTIYRVNLRDPGVLFLTRLIPMRDKDIVYISNAPAVELNKFLTMVQNVTSPARDLQNIILQCTGSC